MKFNARSRAHGVRIGPSRQAGVALLQVLLLTAIVILLAVQMTRTSRTQVHLATALGDRINAELGSRSALNRFIYAQLTGVDGALSRSSALPVNFANLPLTGVEQTAGLHKLSAQDVSGLLPFQYFSHPFWPKYLASLGLDQSQADALTVEFTDMQDENLDQTNGRSEPKISSSGVPYPNRAFQDYTVLDAVSFLTSEQKAAIRADSHLYNIFGVNLSALPVRLALAVLPQLPGSDSRAGRQIEAADKAALAESMVEEISMDAVTFAQGPIVRFSIEWTEREITLIQSWDIRIVGGIEAPFAILRYSHD